MISEATALIFVTIGIIGGIMALKWKKGNVKPRVSDEELDKFLNKES